MYIKSENKHSVTLSLGNTQHAQERMRVFTLFCMPDASSEQCFQ
jgi:hypothetical protein